MSIKIASMNFGDCDTILHNTPNGMKNIVEVLGPNGEVYWTSTKELTGVPPLSIRSNSTMLLDYLISGNMSQTGTPTPTTPIQPSECGERTGNLFDISAYSSYTTGISNIVTTSNSITYTATLTYLAIVYFFPLNTTDIFTIQLGSESSKVRLELRYRKNGSTVGDAIVVTIGNSYVIRGSEGVDEIKINISNETNTGTCTASNIMLNTGSTLLPYEPYGYKIPISSGGGNLFDISAYSSYTASNIMLNTGSTLLPYEPYIEPVETNIYLGEVQTTRRISKLVLTGEEGWVRSVNERCYYINLAKGCPDDYLKSNIVTVMCSHYKGQRNTNSGSNEVNNGCICFFTGGGFELYIGERTITSAENFKTYLQQQYAAGTPVTVWYVLATETTGIVNEPLMKIGDYADTLSYKQAGVQIPTNRGNTVIDVDTTLKPSEMYIKYK